MPGGQDFWWAVEPQIDLAALARDVAGAWQEYGRPWLDLMSDPRAAQTWLERRGLMHWAAVFALTREDRQDAAHLHARAMKESASNRPLASWLRDWGQRHGLR
jgi:hypothetical protein